MCPLAVFSVQFKFMDLRRQGELISNQETTEGINRHSAEMLFAIQNTEKCRALVSNKTHRIMCGHALDRTYSRYFLLGSQSLNLI